MSSNVLEFKPIPQRATLDSRVSDQERICDSTLGLDGG